MIKFIKCILLLIISCCCFAMAIIIIVNYDKLICKAGDGILVFTIIGVLASGFIYAYQYIKLFNEMFLK